MKATIVTIGDELLIGQVVDTNSAWIASQLDKINVRVIAIHSIQDTGEAIFETLDLLKGKNDLVLLTGGLGPTKDDVTKKTLAEFLEDDLVFHEESFDRLHQLFTKTDRIFTERHREQCFVPSKCTVLPNLMGTAQGMWMEKDGTVFIAMPGVPFEMKYIMESSALPMISNLVHHGKIAHKTIMTVGKGETWIEEQIQDIEERYAEQVKIAFLPSLGRVRIRISAFRENAHLLVAEVAKEITARLSEIVFGFDDQPLEAAIGEQLIQEGLTVGTAESCTGGYVAHLITSIPGSSAYYKGSVIAYANEIKENILNVPPSTLEAYGAVSEQTVKAMVTGLVSHLGVDIAVATSGIAGPDGGTPEKPVGTVWLACGDGKSVITEKLQLTKNRQKNIEYSAIAALNMIRKFLTAR